MKRKKGFTLIELLAVIVILAIIALITVPTVIKIINNAKKGAAEDSTYGPTKVAAAASDTHKGIVYLDPTDLTNTCNADNSVSTTGTKTGCMKWYIYDDSGSNYTMILDHNTTKLVEWNETGWNSSMREVATALANDTASWNSSLDARLIEANEIARITGNTTFNQAITDYNGFFYFNSHTQVANNENKSNYAWLFDYTKNCTDYGCSVEDSSTNGYWTSSPVFDDSSSAWRVCFDGGLSYDYVDSWYNNGVRPVITISKSVID